MKSAQVSAFRPVLLVSGLALAAIIGPTACRSSHIEVTTENRTGTPVRLLEIDYPSASFGRDSLASGAAYPYRIQVQGSGPVKVQYTAADGRQVQIQGPSLAERQDGSLEIVLLPGGKAEFHPHLSASPGQ
jgi:hypothetical protein